MQIDIAALVLFGVIVGFLLLVESWYRAGQRDERDESAPPSVTESLGASPRVKGLLYFLSGGFLSGAASLFREIETSNAVVIYATAYFATILLGLIFLFTYAAYYSYTEHREATPNASRKRLFGLALDYAVFMIHEGLHSFRKRLRERHYAQVQRETEAKIEAAQESAKRFVEEAQAELRQARGDLELLKTDIEYLKDTYEGIIDFAAAFTNELSREVAASRTRPCTVEDFLAFAKTHLDMYIMMFLEGKARLDDYRGCLYFHHPSSDQLVFLTGSAPPDALHSERPLPLESVAGYALANPGQPCRSDQESVSFYPRSNPHRYSLVIACAVYWQRNGVRPFTVLNIDLVNHVPEKTIPFLASRTVGFARLLAAAQQALEITPEKIQNYLDGVNPEHERRPASE